MGLVVERAHSVKRHVLRAVARAVGEGKARGKPAQRGRPEADLDGAGAARCQRGPGARVRALDIVGGVGARDRSRGDVESCRLVVVQRHGLGGGGRCGSLAVEVEPRRRERDPGGHYERPDHRLRWHEYLTACLSRRDEVVHAKSGAVKHLCPGRLVEGVEAAATDVDNPHRSPCDDRRPKGCRAAC